MTTKTADVVICGAGIAGISVAWQLRTHPGDANDPEYLAKIESWDDTTQLRIRNSEFPQCVALRLRPAYQQRD